MIAGAFFTVGSLLTAALTAGLILHTVAPSGVRTNNAENAMIVGLCAVCFIAAATARYLGLS